MIFRKRDTFLQFFFKLFTILAWKI